MKDNKIMPEKGIVYECYKSFTDIHNGRCRKGQKFELGKSGSDFISMNKASGRGVSIMVKKDKFAAHFCPAATKPTTPPPTMKASKPAPFKKGDKVKVLSVHGRFGHSFPKNTIGEVTDTHYNDGSIWGIDGSIWGICVKAKDEINEKPYNQVIPSNELQLFVEEVCEHKASKPAPTKSPFADALYLPEGSKLKTTFSELPFMVGEGLAPEGLEGKCLAVYSLYEAHIIEGPTGHQIIYFTRK